jgi:putative hydrolase of HD superfamily
MNHFTTELLAADSSSSKRIRELWEEYEAGQSAEARFVKDLDRFELGLQAVEYEQGPSKLLCRLFATEQR